MINEATKIAKGLAGQVSGLTIEYDSIKTKRRSMRYSDYLESAN